MAETAAVSTAVKKRPVLDFESPGEEQRAYLALFGLFIILPTAYISFMLGSLVFLNPEMAMAVGLSGVMIVGGALGFFLVAINRAVQQVTIKVVQKETN